MGGILAVSVSIAAARLAMSAYGSRVDSEQIGSFASHPGFEHRVGGACAAQRRTFRIPPSFERAAGSSFTQIRPRSGLRFRNFISRVFAPCPLSLLAGTLLTSASYLSTCTACTTRGVMLEPRTAHRQRLPVANVPPTRAGVQPSERRSDRVVHKTTEGVRSHLIPLPALRPRCARGHNAACGPPDSE